MFFVGMLVQLRPRNCNTPLTVADSVYAHAAIHHTLTEANPNVGRALHGMKRHKRMALAIVDSTKRCATLRLAFMDRDGLTCATTLVNAISAMPVLRLGTTMCDVVSVELDGSEWCGVSTWADLLNESSGRYMHVKFVTPTAFTKRDDKGNRFTSLYPDPLDLFCGLARRWQALKGPSLSDYQDLEHFLQTGGCVISSYHLHTVKFDTQERTQIGFIGSAAYECRKEDAKLITTLNALARLATFTGVGYQTARGMGAVQTTISN